MSHAMSLAPHLTVSTAKNVEDSAGISLAGRQGFEPRYRGPEPRVLPLDDLPVPAGSREGQELLILAYPKAPRQTGPLAAGRYRDVCSQRMSSSPKLPRPNWPRGIGFSDSSVAVGSPSIGSAASRCGDCGICIARL